MNPGEKCSVWWPVRDLRITPPFCKAYCVSRGQCTEKSIQEASISSSVQHFHVHITYHLIIYIFLHLSLFSNHLFLYCSRYITHFQKHVYRYFGFSSVVSLLYFTYDQYQMWIICSYATSGRRQWMNCSVVVPAKVWILFLLLGFRFVLQCCTLVADDETCHCWTVVPFACIALLLLWVFVRFLRFVSIL